MATGISKRPALASIPAGGAGAGAGAGIPPAGGAGAGAGAAISPLARLPIYSILTRFLEELSKERLNFWAKHDFMITPTGKVRLFETGLKNPYCIRALFLEALETAKSDGVSVRERLHLRNLMNPLLKSMTEGSSMGFECDTSENFRVKIRLAPEASSTTDEESKAESTKEEVFTLPFWLASNTEFFTSLVAYADDSIPILELPEGLTLEIFAKYVQYTEALHSLSYRALGSTERTVMTRENIYMDRLDKLFSMSVTERLQLLQACDYFGDEEMVKRVMGTFDTCPIEIDDIAACLSSFRFSPKLESELLSLFINRKINEYIIARVPIERLIEELRPYEEIFKTAPLNLSIHGSRKDTLYNAQISDRELQQLSTFFCNLKSLILSDQYNVLSIPAIWWESLEELTLHGSSGITELTDAMPALVKLSLDGATLSNINGLRGSTSLKNLLIRFQSPGSVLELPEEGFPNLETFEATSCCLSSLRSLDGSTSLRELSLFNCERADGSGLPTGCVKLEKALIGPSFSDLSALDNLTMLKELDISHSAATALPKGCIALETLRPSPTLTIIDGLFDCPFLSDFTFRGTQVPVESASRLLKHLGFVQKVSTIAEMLLSPTSTNVEILELFYSLPTALQKQLKFGIALYGGDPLNESFGENLIATNPKQDAFKLTLAAFIRNVGSLIDQYDAFTIHRLYELRTDGARWAALSPDDKRKAVFEDLSEEAKKIVFRIMLTESGHFSTGVSPEEFGRSSLTENIDAEHLLLALHILCTDRGSIPNKGWFFGNDHDPSLKKLSIL